jgi:phosphodiesterase/alkaline phosphatase D-like protein
MNMETANSMDLLLTQSIKLATDLLCSGWGNSLGRIPQPDRTIFTLYDYRKRLATYRTDLDLQLSHQNYAWIPVWDDHGRHSCNVDWPEI